MVSCARSPEFFNASCIRSVKDSIILLSSIINSVLMYRSINDVSDHQILQDDLKKLVHWSTIWLMPCNLNKCEHLIITNKFSFSVYNCKLNDHTIQRVATSCQISWFDYLT